MVNIKEIIMEEGIHPMLIIAGVLGGVMAIAPPLIWLERRLLALWQDRYGPNRAGFFGLFVVLADTIKLFLKEDWIPPFADKKVFVIAPAIVMVAALMGFVIIPFAPGFIVSDLNIGILFFLATSSMGAYSIILGGWASNNKYALLGAMRGAAQMISYEVFMGLSLMGVVVMTGSFSLQTIVEAQRNMWFVIPQFIGFVTFFIAGIAETHRLPFDIPESESEIIAGFHSEYSGMKFGMFFVGEYVGIVLISSITVCLFFGGWLGTGFPATDRVVCSEDFCIHLPVHPAAGLPPATQVRSAYGFWMEDPVAYHHHQPDGDGSHCIVK